MNTAEKIKAQQILESSEWNIMKLIEEIIRLTAMVDNLKSIIESLKNTNN